MIVVLIKYLKRIKVHSFIFFGIGCILLISILFGIISGSSNENPLLLKNKYYAFLIGVLIAPFIETIIFQAIPFYLINRYIKVKKKIFIFIFIAPILFIHDFNLAYILISYIVGFIFALMYYVAYYRKENSIIIISIIHLINNLIAYFAHYLQ